MNTTTKTTKTASHDKMVFTMGLPASGKSTEALKRYGRDYTMIDPDAIKETHPDYDPKDPAALHTWSQDEAERLFATALKSGGRWLVDGTGTNAEKMVRRINEARAAGFSIHLMFVTCTLATSLRRNATRDRVVPAEVIRAKALDINTSYQLIAPHADTLEVIDNDAAW